MVGEVRAFVIQEQCHQDLSPKSKHYATDDLDTQGKEKMLFFTWPLTSITEKQIRWEKSFYFQSFSAFFNYTRSSFGFVTNYWSLGCYVD